MTVNSQQLAYSSKLSNPLHHVIYAGLIEKYKPEVDLFLRSLMYYFSIRINKPTPGMMFQNCKYRNEFLFEDPDRSTEALLTMENDAPTVGQRTGLLVLNIVLDYVWQRARVLMLVSGWADAEPGSFRQQCWVWSKRLNSLYQILSFVNLLVFFRYGRYLTLVDRVLKLRMYVLLPHIINHIKLKAALLYLLANKQTKVVVLVYSSLCFYLFPHHIVRVYENSEVVDRNIVFDYMNRELVFSELTGFVLFVMPLVNWNQVIAVFVF